MYPNRTKLFVRLNACRQAPSYTGRKPQPKYKLAKDPSEIAGGMSERLRSSIVKAREHQNLNKRSGHRQNNNSGFMEKVARGCLCGFLLET